MLIFRKFCPTLKTFFGQVNGLLAWGASVVRCKKFKTPQNVIFTIFKKFKFEKKNFWVRKKLGQIFFWTFRFFAKNGLKACQICLLDSKKEKNLKKNFYDAEFLKYRKCWILRVWSRFWPIMTPPKFENPKNYHFPYFQTTFDPLKQKTKKILITP